MMRRILWSLVELAAFICLLLISVPQLPNLAALYFVYGVIQPLFPSSIGWDDRSAWQKCAGAVAEPRQWPPTPHGACAAMQMCYNEAPISESEIKSLEERMRKIPSCL